jgi:hypothetical protein
MLMKIVSLSTVSFLIMLSINSRNPFEFSHEQPQPTTTHPVSTNLSSSKWSIKEHGDQIMILENCEDGQLRAVEFPQYLQ